MIVINMKKYIGMFLLFIFLLISVNAQTISLPDVKQNTCINLIQTCGNCSFVNLTSITFPTPNNTIQYINSLMTKVGSIYNYTFCDTSQIGTYIYGTLGNPDGLIAIQNIDFLVTPTGDSLSISQSIFYLLTLLLLVGILGIFVRGIVISDTSGYKISYLLGSYIFLLIISFFVYRLVSDYLPTLAYLGTILFYFFFILLILFLPVMLISLGFLVTGYLNEIQKKELMKRGHSQEDVDRKYRRR